MPGKFSLSACIVTYNEENKIRNCLNSVAWADEIIVVDSFSTDNTVEICREFTDRITERPWKGQIDQKSFALSQAQHEWILLIDADEILSPGLIEEIKVELSKNNIKHDGFYFPRRVYYLGRWIDHGEWYPDYKLRLFRRVKGHIGGVEPHDKVELTHLSAKQRVSRTDRVKHMKEDLWHFTYNNIFDQAQTLNEFSSTSAEEMAKQGKSFHLSQILLRPITRFITGYIIRGGFKDGIPGLIIATASSFYVFLKYSKLWEIQTQSRVQNRRSKE